MIGSFENLQVMVTGGTGALGSAVVARLLAAGATCHIPAISSAEIERFPHKSHPRVRLILGGELRDEPTVVRLYDELPGLWASIHCAGGFSMNPIVQTSRDALLEMFDTNALTCFLCCREAVRIMRARAAGAGQPVGGRIVNVAARPAVEPRSGAGMVAYAMAKSAVAALTQALAEELARDRIWVNAVVPGIMDTPANRQAMPGANPSDWAAVDAVAATIVFLASPQNAVTHGGLIPVWGST